MNGGRQDSNVQDYIRKFLKLVENVQLMFIIFLH